MLDGNVSHLKPVRIVLVFFSCKEIVFNQSARLLSYRYIYIYLATVVTKNVREA